MSDCVYTIGEREFKTEDELYDYILNAQANKAVPDNLTQDEVVSMIKEVGNAIKFEKQKLVDGQMVDAHDYTVGGKPMVSVSSVIEQKYPYMGSSASPRGEMANKTGTAIHDLAEEIINKLNKGVSQEQILNEMVDKSAFMVKWANSMFELYSGWSDGGANKILTEFRIANSEQGVAGTVDVAVISPDGSVKLYDFKGTGTKYLKEEDAGVAKRRANNFQLNLYKRMLEVGDKNINLKKLNVVGAAIIPVELDIPVDGSVVNDINVLPAQEFDNPSVFPDHEINKIAAKSAFPAEGHGITKTFLSSSQIADWKGFLRQLTNFDFNTFGYASKAESYARQAQFDHKKGEYYAQIGKEMYYFENPIAQTDPSEKGIKARQDEIERTEVKDQIETKYASDALDLVHYINFGATISVQVEDVSNAKVQNIRQLGAKYKQNVDRAVQANQIAGLEDVGDDVVIVYKGFNPDTGTSAAIDILTVNPDVTGDIEQKLEKGTTIAGKYIKDSQASTYTNKAGLHGENLWKNTKKNAHLLKMGLVAMHLKNEHPELAVDRLIVDSLGSNSSYAPDQIGIPVLEVIKQIKILDTIKTKEGKGILHVAYGADEKIPKLLGNKELLDYKGYKSNGLEAYLRYASSLLIYNRDAMLNPKPENEKVQGWVNVPKHKKLLSGIFSEDGLNAILSAVDKSDKIKSDMLEALIARQNYIERKIGAGQSEAYLDDLEYNYVSKAILELSDLSDNHSSFHSLNYATRKLITPGMTGISIVDEYIGRVQRTIADMNRKIYKEFFTESRKMHKKLLKDMKATGKIAKNQAADVYLPLMEQITVNYENSSESVSRVTGRFWPEDSDEFKALSSVQKDYVIWYKKKVKESMTYGMTDAQKEDFYKYWSDDMIPDMRPSTDSALGDIFGSDSSEGAFTDKVSNWFHRSLDPFNSKNDYVENMSNNYEEMVDKLEKHKTFRGAPDFRYGDVARMERLGFNANGSAKRSYIRPGDVKQTSIPITRTMETNLESVLAYTMMNKYRMAELNHLVPEFKAVKSIIARANSGLYKENDNLLDYLKTFVEKNLFQKNQITKDQEGLAKTAQAARIGTNFILLDYHVGSQAKNTIAGFFHTMSTAMANKELGKNIFKAFSFVMNPKNFEFYDAMMWQMGLANADSDQLVNGFHTQLGKRGAASSFYKNLINYGGDYFYRSVFMVANMMKDGVINTYSQTGDVGGKSWKYDEDKDPRFKGDQGEAVKTAIKEQLRKEGKLDENGRMLTPYTAYELQYMKREANEAFEAQNNEDQENFRNEIGGLLFGQFRNWWYQKVKRYAMKGAYMENMKQLVTKPVYDDNGKITGYVSEYEGTYMEGIFYTLTGLATSIKTAYDVGNPMAMKDYYLSMSSHQKENVRRFLKDFAMLAALIATGSLIFDDDDDKGSSWYYLWYGAANEINIWSHLTASPIIGTGSSIPSVGLVQRILENPLRTLTEPGFVKSYRFFVNEE